MEDSLMTGIKWGLRWIYKIYTMPLFWSLASERMEANASYMKTHLFFEAEHGKASRNQSQRCLRWWKDEIRLHEQQR